jgi:hypothetical protein
MRRGMNRLAAVELFLELVCRPHFIRYRLNVKSDGGKTSARTTAIKTPSLCNGETMSVVRMKL